MAMTISMKKSAYKLSNLTNNNYCHDNSAELIVTVATLKGTEAYDNYYNLHNYSVSVSRPILNRQDLSQKC